MSDDKPIAMTRRVGNPNMVRGSKSLNPKGRPKKGFTASDIVASHITADEVVSRMISLLDHLSENGQNTREQVALLTLISGYVLGKPATTIDLNVQNQDEAWHAPAGWSSWPQARRHEYLMDMRQRALSGVIDVGDDVGDDDDDGGDDE